MCGGRAKPHKWAVLHQRSDKPLVDNGTTPSTQYHRCLPEEMEALGCVYGRPMDMVSIAQLAIEGNSCDFAGSKDTLHFSPTPPYAQVRSGESGRESVGRTVAYSVVSSA